MALMSCFTGFSITSHAFQFCKKDVSELLINGLVVFNEFMKMFLLLQGGRDMLKDVWKNVDMMDPETQNFSSNFMVILRSF